MRTLLYDCNTVMLEVQYTIAADGVPEFHSIKVLDAEYRATGPDLTNMLHMLVALQQEHPPAGDRVLSLICKEILSERN